MSTQNCASADSKHQLPKWRLKEALQYSASHEGLSLIVLQNGKIVLENYHNDYAENQTHRLTSITKNIWALSALAAVQDGYLDLNERVSATIREWQHESGKTDIRIRDLLDMNSGLNPGFKELYWVKPASSPLTAIKLPLDEEPRSAFMYGPGNMEVFGEILKRKLRPRKIAPLAYVESRLFSTLNLNYDEWKTDRVGNPMMSSGLKLSARNLLKIGQVVLYGGSYRGKQLFSPTLFNRVVHGSVANPSYGFTFWLNTAAGNHRCYEVNVEEVLESKERFTEWQGTCISKDAPPDMISMIGSGNQRIYVMPSLDLVIARQGEGKSFADREFLGILFRD